MGGVVDLAHLLVGLTTPILLVLVLISLAVLVNGADRLVEDAAALAERVGLPPVVVGATIVSLGTTSPECAVSVLASWSGRPGLALGNAVGSIIADTGLIFGLCCMLARLPADRFLLAREGRVQFGSALLLAVMCYAGYVRSGADAMIPRSAGVMLLVLLLGYMFMSVRWARDHAQAVVNQQFEDSEEKPRALSAVVLGLIFGVIAVGAGSHLLVESVSLVALRWGVPNVVIAATLVAFGTSLPELMVGLTAVRRGELDILVGNVIGADILNVLFVIGASAIAAPLPIIDPSSQIPAIFLMLHLPVMLAILIVFRLFIARATRTGFFDRVMGIPLVATYVMYVVLQLAITRAA